MPTLLDSIYNPDSKIPENPPKPPKKTLLEDVFNSISAGNATDIQLGQYGVGESQYDTNVTPESVVNLEEIRAQKQSALDKWGNGLVKAAGTFGTGFLENTAGVVIGLGSAIIDNDINKFYNNKFTQSLDEFNKYVADNLPNYHTKAEEDYNLLQKLGTSNFWSDQVLNGAAYLGSAIATGAGLNKLASLGKLARTGQVINEAELAANGWKTLDKAAKTVKFADAVDFAKNAALMSYGESSIEARGIYNDTKNALIEKYKEENNGADPDAAVLAEIESRAKAAGNFGFATNLAITGTTNALLFPKLLTKGYDANKLGLNKITLQGAEYVAEQSSVAKSVGKELIKGSLEEGGQELGQLLTQKTLTDYYSKGYENRGEKGDFVNSLVYGLQQTFGTEEGLENFFLGALLGGPAGAIQTRGDASQRNKNTQQIADIMNTPEFKKTVNSFDNFVRATNYEKEKEEALATGSKFDYLNAEFNQNKSIVKQFLDNGGKDILIQQYRDMQGLPEEEFKKVAGYEENQALPKSQIEIVDNAVKFVNNLEKTNVAIQQLFPYNPKIHGSPEEYKIITDNLWHYSTSIDNMNQRIDSINRDAINLAAEKNLPLTGDGINVPYSVQDNPIVNAQLQQFNDDLKVAKTYKEKLIQSYNLLANPNTQKQTVNDIVTTAQEKAILSTPIPEQELANTPVEENVAVEDQNLDNRIDFPNLINQATSERELDSILNQIDKEGLSTPELINQLSIKREELKNSTISPKIDTRFGNNRYKAQTIWKTTAGQDNDEKLPEQRYFRYLRENNLPKDAKLRVVTKNNNPELFNELLDESAKNYQEKTGIDTIYTVLVNKNGNPIYADQEGKKIKSGDKNNLIYATLLTENGIKGTSVKSDLAKQDLNNFRSNLLDQSSPDIFLPITGRTKGVEVKKEGGESEFRNRYLTFDPTNIEGINIEAETKPTTTEPIFVLSERELEDIQETIDNPLFSQELKDELTEELKNVKSPQDVGKLFRKICQL